MTALCRTRSSLFCAARPGAHLRAPRAWHDGHTRESGARDAGVAVALRVATSGSHRKAEADATGISGSADRQIQASVLNCAEGPCVSVRDGDRAAGAQGRQARPKGMLSEVGACAGSGAAIPRCLGEEHLSLLCGSPVEIRVVAADVQGRGRASEGGGDEHEPICAWKTASRARGDLGALLPVLLAWRGAGCCRQQGEEPAVVVRWRGACEESPRRGAQSNELARSRAPQRGEELALFVRVRGALSTRDKTPHSDGAYPPLPPTAPQSRVGTIRGEFWLEIPTRRGWPKDEGGVVEGGKLPQNWASVSRCGASADAELQDVRSGGGDGHAEGGEMLLHEGRPSGGEGAEERIGRSVSGDGDDTCSGKGEHAEPGKVVRVECIECEWTHARRAARRHETRRGGANRLTRVLREFEGSLVGEGPLFVLLGSLKLALVVRAHFGSCERTWRDCAHRPVLARHFADISSVSKMGTVLERGANVGGTEPAGESCTRGAREVWLRSSGDPSSSAGGRAMGEWQRSNTGVGAWSQDGRVSGRGLCTAACELLERGGERGRAGAESGSRDTVDGEAREAGAPAKRRREPMREDAGDVDASGSPLRSARGCSTSGPAEPVTAGQLLVPSARARAARVVLTLPSSLPLPMLVPTRWVGAGWLAESSCQAILRAQDARFVCATRGPSSALAFARVEPAVSRTCGWSTGREGDGGRGESTREGTRAKGGVSAAGRAARRTSEGGCECTGDGGRRVLSKEDGATRSRIAGTSIGSTSVGNEGERAEDGVSAAGSSVEGGASAAGASAREAADGGRVRREPAGRVRGAHADRSRARRSAARMSEQRRARARARAHSAGEVERMEGEGLGYSPEPYPLCHSPCCFLRGDLTTHSSARPWGARSRALTRPARRSRRRKARCSCVQRAGMLRVRGRAAPRPSASGEGAPVGAIACALGRPERWACVSTRPARRSCKRETRCSWAQRAGVRRRRGSAVPRPSASGEGPPDGALACALTRRVRRRAEHADARPRVLRRQPRGSYLYRARGSFAQLGTQLEGCPPGWWCLERSGRRPGARGAEESGRRESRGQRAARTTRSGAYAPAQFPRTSRRTERALERLASCGEWRKGVEGSLEARSSRRGCGRCNRARCSTGMRARVPGMVTGHPTGTWEATSMKALKPGATLVHCCQCCWSYAGEEPARRAHGEEPRATSWRGAQSNELARSRAPQRGEELALFVRVRGALSTRDKTPHSDGIVMPIRHNRAARHARAPLHHVIGVSVRAVCGNGGRHCKVTMSCLSMLVELVKVSCTDKPNVPAKPTNGSIMRQKYATHTLRLSPWEYYIDVAAAHELGVRDHDRGGGAHEDAVPAEERERKVARSSRGNIPREMLVVGAAVLHVAVRSSRIERRRNDENGAARRASESVLVFGVRAFCLVHLIAHNMAEGVPMRKDVARWNRTNTNAGRTMPVSVLSPLFTSSPCKHSPDAPVPSPSSPREARTCGSDSDVRTVAVRDVGWPGKQPLVCPVQVLRPTLDVVERGEGGGDEREHLRVENGEPGARQSWRKTETPAGSTSTV
ncbi:uncharacterized protein C8Q71DRAFT_727390 [Rhodofomes roseus]|uniref:Uncharacterized protein n=1 Tax=Rhodofomes roseus TaxID=34475 RepID=A0ABQ8K1W0_9APHY|nr:uncharacterized protein C8Q71DRAFT_727390 [Rhodofomes roseus]KAH9830653.1 hypothetical protein C8Q71DRAFT_727390 [Rhodofomes roseus]